MTFVLSVLKGAVALAAARTAPTALTLLLTLACSVTLAGGAQALVTPPKQEPAKPGPEHELLKEWAGNWEAAISAGGAESKGSVTAKVGLGGLWLMDELKSEIAGMAFEGRGSLSYDPAKKKYVHIWIDSMSTSPMISEGTYDKATKTLSLKGTMPMPDGTSMKVTQTTVTKDADTRIFTLKGAGPDGNPIEMLTVTYKRQKK